MVRGAVVHEPPLLGVLPHEDGPTPLDAVFALAQTDPEAALEAFVRLNSSDSAWEAANPAVRNRMVDNAGTPFQYEVAQFITYKPNVSALHATTVPVTLLHSVAGVPFIPGVNAWLHEHIGWTSSHHAPYFDTAAAFAEEIRPLLKQLQAA